MLKKKMKERYSLEINGAKKVLSSVISLAMLKKLVIIL
jgi:hypothetical protein